MYLRGERPLTSDDRQQLEQRLALTQEDIGESVFKVVLLGLFDGIAVFAAVCTILYGDKSGTIGRLLGGLAVLIANAYLISLAFRLRHGLQERRLLRQVLAESVLITERVEATGVVYLRGRINAWFILTVEPTRLLVLPEALSWYARCLGRWTGEGGQFPAVFEIASTNPGRLLLGQEAFGQSSLPLAMPRTTWSICPDKTTCRRLELLLKQTTLLAGSLDTLTDDLRRLVQSRTGLQTRPDDSGESSYGPRPEPQPVAADAWPLALLQGRIETTFAIELGAGGLAARLWHLEKEQGRPATAADLLPLVLEHLPPGARAPAQQPLQALFFHLRGVLSEQLQLPRQSIRPSTRLEDIVPRQSRRACCDRLFRQLGHFYPDLVEETYPRMVSILILVGVGAAIFLYGWMVQAVLGLLRGWGLDSLWWLIPLGLVALLAFVWWLFLCSRGLLALFRRWAILEFRQECATVGQLVRGLARSEGPGAEEGVPWTAETVWLALRQLLADRASVRPLAIARATAVREILTGSAPDSRARNQEERP